MKSADWMAVPESLGDMPLKRLEKKISWYLWVKCGLMWVDLASCLYLYRTVF